MADETDRSLAVNNVTLGGRPARFQSSRDENAISPPLSREGGSETGQPSASKEEVRAAIERVSRDPLASTETGAKPKKRKASLEAGDVPREVAQRYFSEAQGGARSFYPDAQTKDAAFLDAGNKLSAERTDPNVISDMLKVAEHRGWEKLDVSGTSEFRREVWMQGHIKGVEVRGYKPTERDLQELERRQPDKSQEAGGDIRRRDVDGSTRDARAERPSAERGITGKLVEKGEAPYQGRMGAGSSAYVKLELDGGQSKTLWGVGLADALQRAGAEIGDTVTVKREGFEQVTKQVMSRDGQSGEPIRDGETGRPLYENKSVNRGMWTVTADKFLNADKETRMADPVLRGADSQMRVIESYVNARTSDQRARDRLLEGARRQIANGLAEGARFPEARVFSKQRADRSIQKPVSDLRTEPDKPRASERAMALTELQEPSVDSLSKAFQQRTSQEKRSPERERTR